mmetsp:Transcript_15418/g.23638  ORF Transcript_15418/g.23638 Transcript_15418/m.23638 type:complete len:706 (-) Transcript_15418:346-2463(-)
MKSSVRLPTTTDSAVVRKNGTYRHRYKVRALCQSIAIVLLVIGYTGYRSFVPEATAGLNAADDSNAPKPSWISSSSSFATSLYLNSHHENTSTATTHSDYTTTTSSKSSHSNNKSVIHRFLTQGCGKKADPAWTSLWWILLLIYMFLALSIICDEFFVPALEEMSSEKHLNLSMDVAGATLMAAGGSAPELATNFVATFQQSELGVGTIVGSAVFNVLFVIAMCSLLAKSTLTLTWWPLFRDSSFYAITLIFLAIFLSVSGSGDIVIWESICLFLLYLVYCTFMYFNQNLYKALTGKELEYPEEPPESDDENDDDKKDGEELNSNTEEKPPADEAVDAEEPMRNSNNSNHVVVDHRTSNKMLVNRWQNTFRAGILKLLRDPDSWLDTAGVGIVAKMTGDVNQVFKEVDVNGDGTIDREELALLFEKLECHLSPHELDEVFAKLDADGNNKICAEEFSAWYVCSEERILSQVRSIFDSFDANNSGTIERHELKQLLGKLEPRVTDEDVEDAILQMYQSGSRDEITFEEFSEWYKHSLLYQRKKLDIEEDSEGVHQNLYPPKKGSGILAWLKYIVVLPLVFILTFTIPDVQRPGREKWCYVAFILSICWIGFFSWVMVECANILGATAGIPDVIMGLTFIAAGTSIPDLLSSVIVARRGYGDMAVSSSIGSNIFDITVGLPLPWFIYQIYDLTRGGDGKIVVSWEVP